MNELRSVVPICDHERKSYVLQKAIEYITFLYEQYNDLLERSKRMQDDYHKLGGNMDFIGPHLLQPATSIGHNNNNNNNNNNNINNNNVMIANNNSDGNNNNQLNINNLIDANNDNNNVGHDHQK